MNTQTNLFASNDVISKLLIGLFDAEVDVEQLDSTQGSVETAYLGVFGGEDKACQAVCWCRLSLANTLGAALAVIPPTFANESTDAGEHPDNLRENFNEVMNLCANLFPKKRSAHFSLQAVYTPTSNLPDDVTSLLADETAERADVRISVERYNSGVLTMLTK